MNVRLCFLALLSSVVAAAQTAPPKVVFVGDEFTNEWQSSAAFQANPNWIGAGIVTAPVQQGSGIVLSRFQTDVINQHPAIVHILLGGSNIAALSPGNNIGLLTELFVRDITAMVRMAQAANIKVILGTIPSMTGKPFEEPGYVLLFNVWLEQFGLANNIPVVNYHDLLCTCVGSTGTPSDLYSPVYAVVTAPPTPAWPAGVDQTLSPAGYAAITLAAQTEIAIINPTVKTGYLQNTGMSPFSDQPLASDVNSVPVGEILQFTPQATYSDGATHPLTNTDITGRNGIWTSSNPAVMSVDQDGRAFAYSPGTANISFKTTSGVYFNPWTMTVTHVFDGD